MSFFINDTTHCSPIPLPSGHYYLVDCAEHIADFMKAPVHVRMQGVSEGEELSEYEMVDAELSDLMPYLTDRNFIDGLDRHIDDMLEEGISQLAFQFEMRGQEIPYEILRNTPEQLAHAEALFEFGNQMASVLREQKFYNESNELMVEYHSLLDNGVVVFRKAEELL